MRTAERSKSKSFYREAVSMTATHVRNGVVSGPADFGWGGPLRANRGIQTRSRRVNAWDYWSGDGQRADKLPRRLILKSMSKKVAGYRI
jgi:hypothetical protein